MRHDRSGDPAVSGSPVKRRRPARHGERGRSNRRV